MQPPSAPCLILPALLALAGCAADTAPTAATSASTRPRIPIQQFLPEQASGPGAGLPDAGAPGAGAPAPGATGDGAAEARQNDPSAPLDTPLCGRAEREAIAIDTAVAPTVLASAGSCAATACFDPLTDTFIGADGARHVCQE